MARKPPGVNGTVYVQSLACRLQILKLTHILRSRGRRLRCEERETQGSTSRCLALRSYVFRFFPHWSLWLTVRYFLYPVILRELLVDITIGFRGHACCEYSYCCSSFPKLTLVLLEVCHWRHGHGIHGLGRQESGWVSTLGQLD